MMMRDREAQQLFSSLCSGSMPRMRDPHTPFVDGLLQLFRLSTKENK